jgi:hypothetical protein
LWVSVVGLRWSALALGFTYALIGLLVIVRALYHLYSLRVVIRTFYLSPAAFHLPPATFHLALPIILLLALLTRLLAIRDLAAPMWVDSSHHLLIARVLAETGHIPANYQPLLPVDRFYYHWGYHVLLVGAYWLSQGDWPELMLTLGQVLNALTPLAVYAGAELLTGQPRAGLWAAFVVALVSFFPGYYVSWGRYTQLTGLLILAPLLGVLWQLLRPEKDWAAAQQHPSRWRAVWGASLLVAGLFLAHYRVLAFLVTFGWAIAAFGGRGGWKWLSVVAGLGGLLALPWLVQLFQQAVLPVLAAPERIVATGGYNDFPVDYFRGELERGWLRLAVVAAGWGLLRRERTVWVLGGWAAVTSALLNIGPGTWLVNNNAWAISLFLPAAIALGWGADQWLRLVDKLATWASPQPRAVSDDPAPTASSVFDSVRESRLFRVVGLGLRWLVVMLFVGILVYGGARGLLLQSNIANPVTRLVAAEDMDALAWVEHNTPPDAVFVVNGWKWLGNAWAGSDGGAWLWPLAGRRTTLPPVDYLYQADWARAINAFNEKLAALTDADTPDTLALLREMGVTHVFIGAKGGSLKPESFLDSPHYRLLYTNGAAWVFEVTGE